MEPRMEFDDGVGLGEFDADAAVIGFEHTHRRCGWVLDEILEHSRHLRRIDGTFSIKAEGSELFGQLQVGFGKGSHGLEGKAEKLKD